MPKIMVIDDEAVIREPIAEGIRARGHEVKCAGDAPTALAQVLVDPPDLILLDVKLPGQDGISLFRQFRAHPLTAHIPVIFLTNAADRTSILQVASLKAQGYVLKSAFSFEELLQRISRLCLPAPSIVVSQRTCGKSTVSQARINPPSTGTSTATAPLPPEMSAWPRLLATAETMERLDDIAGGRTLAGVVSELLSVSNSPESTLTDVVRIVQSDPVLAARVLRLANGAAAGARGHVRDIEDAARNLGVRGIQNLAITIGIIGAFPPDEGDGFNIMRCWQHSYAVADLFDKLMSGPDSQKSSRYHLIGLCHEMGEILLRQHFAKEYAVIHSFSSEHCLPLHRVQSVALGIRPSELVNRLLTRIGLPTDIVDAIREFTEWQTTGLKGAPTPQCLALDFANSYAHGLQLASSMSDTVRPITTAEWRRLNRGDPPPALDPAAKRMEILTATSVLARLSPGEEKLLLTPLIPRQEMRLWYTRPTTFIEWDPLAAALSFGADVTISDQLPDSAQLQEYDALVICAARANARPIIPDEIRQLLEASCRPDLPTLALSGETCPDYCFQNTVIRRAPLPLDELALWLDKSGKQQKKSASA